MDKKVRNYLDNLPEPQKAICTKVRKLIFKTFPDIHETFENGVPWYECKYYISGQKDHVNIGFSVEGLTEEEKNLFEGKGNFLRHIKLYSLSDFDETKLVKLLKVVNRAEMKTAT